MFRVLVRLVYYDGTEGWYTVPSWNSDVAFSGSMMGIPEGLKQEKRFYCWMNLGEEDTRQLFFKDFHKGPWNPIEEQEKAPQTFKKCVHTEHCCAQFGCKYGEDALCPVWLGDKPQSFGYFDGRTTQPIPNIPREEFNSRRERIKYDYIF